MVNNSGWCDLSVLIFIMVDVIIPYTKTNFKSYDAFREKTNNYYPDEQPESAGEIKYYYYHGMFDNFSAVAFTVDTSDFAHLSERYIIYFEKFRFDSTDGSARYENQAIPENFMQEENIEFLNDMIEGSLDNYKIVEYYGSSKISERRSVLGVVGNESTGEIIIFDGYDCFPE